MAIEIVDIDYSVVENMLIIKPKPIFIPTQKLEIDNAKPPLPPETDLPEIPNVDGEYVQTFFKDNSIYEVRIKAKKDVEDKFDYDMEDQTIKFISQMTPSYCKLIDVESLINIIDIPPDIVLYNIREASAYADYLVAKIRDGETLLLNNVPFYIKEFVRYKAAKDCLLKIYMSLVTTNTVEGMLGEVKFKLREKIPDIKSLLQYLDMELQKWIDAIKDKDIEGRARMKTAIKGKSFEPGSYGLGKVPLGIERRRYKK